jgi:hypothetical protein
MKPMKELLILALCALCLGGCETTGSYSYAPISYGYEPSNQEIMLQLQHMETMREIDESHREIEADAALPYVP